MCVPPPKLTLPPPLASECAPTPGTKGRLGGHTCLRVRGRVSPTTGEKLSTLPTLWTRVFCYIDVQEFPFAAGAAGRAEG